MNKDQLFSHLKKQKPSVLIQLLDDCYSGMKTHAIGEVFGHLEKEFEDKSVEGKKVLKSVQKFVNDSLKGKYYAPFDVNSKNCMDIPEETDMWFEELADLLTDSSELSAQGDHIHAVKCFQALFTLIDKLGDDEIVFADELGMWMLPIEEGPCIKAYCQSAAAIFGPEDYVKAVLPVIRDDSYSGFSNKAYEKAKSAANKNQKSLLDEQIIKHRIKTSNNTKE